MTRRVLRHDPGAHKPAQQEAVKCGLNKPAEAATDVLLLSRKHFDRMNAYKLSLTENPGIRVQHPMGLCPRG